MWSCDSGMGYLGVERDEAGQEFGSAQPHPFRRDLLDVGWQHRQDTPLHGEIIGDGDAAQRTGPMGPVADVDVVTIQSRDVEGVPAVGR